MQAIRPMVLTLMAPSLQGWWLESRETSRGKTGRLFTVGTLPVFNSCAGNSAFEELKMKDEYFEIYTINMDIPTTQLK